MARKCKYSKTSKDVEKEDLSNEDKVFIKQGKSPWSNILGKIKVIAPYLWPKDSLSLQLRVVTCVVLIISLRVVNVIVPRLNRDLIDTLAMQDGQFPLGLILLYTFVKLLQGGTGPLRGIIGTAKNALWVKVEQNTTKELKVALFEHIHSLGIRWHQSRKTGEVLRIVDRGTASVTTILNTAFFQVIPIIIDSVIAMGALSYDLNGYFGLIILVTMIVYLVIAVIGTEYRTAIKRKMNDADNEQRARSVDSLLNSETVKLYGNEAFESKQFAFYIDIYQRKEWVSRMLMYGFNTVQILALNGGLVIGSLYCAYLISQHQLTVGDYALFTTYMMQLMAPLNQLATLYRTIQEALVNMENMFDLMAVEEEIKDIPSALDLPTSNLKISLQNVSFYYDVKQPILKNISLTVPEGSSVAIVGPSGSGKSTLLKLLLRFYDPIEGSVKIGETNVKHVKQSSLRQNIGVVPQDTVLFNDSVEYNLRYGKTEASNDEIEDASKLAKIHDRILDLPDGYKTKVGERGLKLSGGEKQRVAIARTLLRSSKIIILDEATSSLDSATEKGIQESLAEVSSEKTCVIVAHRLSTIQNVNNIIVLKDGEIVEEGSHDHLISMDKVYAEMWKTQNNAMFNS